MTIDLQSLTFMNKRKFCQKEEIDHVLGNYKGARDHLVSTEWTTGKNVNRLSFSE